MINWSSKHIGLIAIFFFAAFAGVFTTNALCDLEIIEYAPNLAHNHSNESTHTSHEEKYKNDHGHQNSDDHNQDANSDNPCCNDVTSQLESSLFSKIIKNQIIDAKYFLLRGISVLSNLFSLYQSTDIIYHEYDTPPPLSGFNMRVLIQSFLN